MAQDRRQEQRRLDQKMALFTRENEAVREGKTRRKEAREAESAGPRHVPQEKQKG